MNQQSRSRESPAMETQRADVAVIGAGLAGLVAAFDLAEMGRRVIVVEQSSAHGGHLVLLDRQFPTDTCGLCQILPHPGGEGPQACLKTILDHPRVRLMLNTRLQGVDGEAGRFTIRLRTDHTGVDARRCTRCGRCVEACPESYPDPFQAGIFERKAVDWRSPLCMGSCPSIDWSHCDRCGACVEACPEGAIHLEQVTPWEGMWQVGALVLAPGFRPVDAARRPEYGYGRLPHVVTSLELERLLAKAQMEGHPVLRRPSDGEVPSRIAWIQCVGSRDRDRPYCSSVCCMISLKEARLCRALLPQAHLEIFYMDLRCAGKGYESYLMAAQEMGIRLSRGRPAEVLLRGDRPMVQVERADGSWTEEPFDLVVLSAGFEIDEQTRRIAEILEIPLDPDGFLQTVSGTLSCTAKEGIYVAGCAARPQDIPESVAQAHEAAALASLHAGGEPDQAQKAPQRTGQFDPAGEDLRVLVALCDCSGTLADSFQWDRLQESIQGEAGVVGLHRGPHICLQEGMEELRSKMEETGANALVVGSCTPRWLLPRLLSRLSHPAVDPHLVEVVNLREQAAWPRTERIQEKTRQARAQLLAALAKVRAYRCVPPLEVEPPRRPSSRVLVLGGGPAGLCAAVQAGRLGRKVTLVERSSELGGHLRALHTVADPHLHPSRLLDELRREVSSLDGVQVLTSTSVVSLTGRAGAFRAIMEGGDGERSEDVFGAVILATGGDAHAPPVYGYGRNPRVMTQKELEAALAESELDPASIREVIMIQCAGSRDQQLLPYCSRICCASALKNARSLLEANPRLRLIVLYRDMRAFGTLERLYTEIRQRGGLFIPFEPGDPPRVEEDDEGLMVEARDPLVGIRVRFRPDRVILSTGITPRAPGEILRSLGVETDPHGFLRERNPKFRPLDLAEGVFACGLALGPAFLEEAMAQGRGAALRACGFLRRMEMSHPQGIGGAWVHPRRCSACGLCVQSCPFDARRLEPEQGHAVVEAALCQSCGTCTAVCPNDATQLRETSDGQVLSAIDALMEV